ncbi:amiloride-sensitive sodium channel subunit beta-like [Uloborus diversus]|uniref:amiloride-sensitive sodium channel subunit beta-like n=1 Tax=Uloborus diversus TaxID=327109 RepID=UPI00240998A0|nr:amiloride-sensitive sodium channel subunit beta-like [Uloborus diversus]
MPNEYGENKKFVMSGGLHIEMAVSSAAYADSYFDHSKGKASITNQCFQSETELLSESAVDLSDTWLNLGLTKDDLSKYGHQSQDLIVQCTYNSKNCFSNHTSFRVVVSNVTSPVFGLCHSISVRDKKENRGVSVKKGGTTNGLRLTLNIEREDYWNLISAEFGVRLLVHPQFTYPTLKRGGIVISPGRSAHIGVRRHCNTLCENTILFSTCGCLDEQPRSAKDSSGWKFCNPCNKEHAICRSQVYRNFSELGNVCDDVCKPACRSVRYEITLSKSDWPNLSHQQYVMNRSWDQWTRIPQAAGLMDITTVGEEEEADFVNDTFFRENLLRVHLYMEEMIYMSIEERYSYTLPKLLADLGGCLGLYLGVSVVSIIELIELLGSASIVCLCRDRQRRTPDRPADTRRRRRRGRSHLPRTSSGRPPASTAQSGIRTALGFLQARKKNRDERTWRYNELRLLS